MIDKENILAGRQAVDAYREAHHLLYSKPWHRGIPEEHTPLLEKLVADLEKIGVTSATLDFEPKKTEILAKFFDSNKEYCLLSAGFNETNVAQDREDLLLLENVPLDGQEIQIKLEESDKDSYATLVIDGKNVMQTGRSEHASMYEAVQECPHIARVLVGGLGLGLIQLYLADSGKTKEVIVCEINTSLINIFAEPCVNWFASTYPDFNISILAGDVAEKVQELGKFDWIFLDTDTPWEQSQFETYLNEGGKITYWKPFTLEWS